MNKLVEAITKYKKIEGKRWKSKLKADWADGSYFYAHSSYKDVLQRLRNNDGFEILDKIKFDMTEIEILEVLKLMNVKKFKEWYRENYSVDTEIVFDEKLDSTSLGINKVVTSSPFGFVVLRYSSPQYKGNKSYVFWNYKQQEKKEK